MKKIILKASAIISAGLGASTVGIATTTSCSKSVATYSITPETNNTNDVDWVATKTVDDKVTSRTDIYKLESEADNKTSFIVNFGTEESPDNHVFSVKWSYIPVEEIEIYTERYDKTGSWQQIPIKFGYMSEESYWYCDYESNHYVRFIDAEGECIEETSFKIISIEINDNEYAVTDTSWNISYDEGKNTYIANLPHNFTEITGLTKNDCSTNDVVKFKTNINYYFLGEVVK